MDWNCPLCEWWIAWDPPLKDEDLVRILNHICLHIFKVTGETRGA